MKKIIACISLVTAVLLIILGVALYRAAEAQKAAATQLLVTKYPGLQVKHLIHYQIARGCSEGETTYYAAVGEPSSNYQSVSIVCCQGTVCRLN